MEWRSWRIVLGGGRAAARRPTAGGGAAARWAAGARWRVDAQRRRHLGAPRTRQCAFTLSWSDGEPHLHRAYCHGNYDAPLLNFCLRF